jgi:hypothetical protein
LHLQVTASGEVVRASADYLLNSGAEDVESVYSWAALAAGNTKSLGSQTAILTSVTTSQCNVNSK